MASPEPDSSQNLDSVLPPSRGRKQPPSGLPLQGSGKHQGSPSSKVKTRPRSEQDSPELGSMSDPQSPNPAKRQIHRATRQYGAGAETKAQQPSSPLAGGVRSDSKRGSAPPTVGRGSPAPTILAQQGHPGGGTEVEAGSPQVRQAEDKAAKRRSVHLATRPYGAPREEPVPETPPNPVVDEGRSPEGKKRSLLSVIPSKLLRRGRSSYRPNNLSKAPPAPFSIEAAYLPANQGGEKANPEKSKGYDGLPSVMMSMGMSSQGEIVASSTAWGGESDLNNTEMALDDGAHEVEEEVEDGAAFQRERPVPVSESKFYPSMVMEEKEESEVSWDGVYQAPRRGEWSGLARYEPKKKGSVDEEYSRNLGNPLESISDLDMSEVVGIAVPLSDAQGSPARPTGKSRFGTVSGKSPKGAVGTGKAMGDDEVVNEMELQRQKWDEQLTAEQKHQIVVDEAENNEAFSKVIREEGKMGQKTLGMAVSELDDLQRRHKQGMRLEARALANHSKMLSTYTNVRSSLEEAKKRYEVMEGRFHIAERQLRQADDMLWEHKEHVRKAMDMAKEKKEEVEILRKQFGVDQRERAVHLDELNPTDEREGGAEGDVVLVSVKTRFGSPS